MSKFANNALDTIVSESQIKILRNFTRDVPHDLQLFGLVVLLSEFLLARYSVQDKDDEYCSYSDAFIVSKHVPAEYKETAYTLVQFRNVLCHSYGSPVYYDLYNRVRESWLDIRELFKLLGVLPNADTNMILRKYKEKYLKNTDVKLVDEVERLAYRYNIFNINALAKKINRDML